ncbi:MAG: endonuclease MutS2 [SAR202 cluster bacterium]|nr:endonuclease MutS2 [SAR202 cluster bacterium]MQG78745.1 endonuclease MutS2 [SAR202 cluster bacterium]
MSDAEPDLDNPPVSMRHDFSTRTAPTTWDSDLGGFGFSGPLLEFDQVREQIAAYTKTVVGGERARALTPTRDLLEIATRQQETSEARQYLDQGGGLEFGPEEDFRELLQRALLGGLLRGEELFLVRELLRAARYDRTEMGRHEEIPLLTSVSENIPELSDLERAISGAISPAGEVLDNASPVLHNLRREARNAQNRLNEIMERNLRRLQRAELVQEPLITQRNGRMVLLIKAEMRYRVPGIVHDVSDSGATVFVEPMPAIDMGNRWREARLAEEREVERILRQLSGMVGLSGEDLLLTLDLMARLDLDIAKARHSAAINAVAPWVSDQEVADRHLKLVRARHPLLTGAVVPVSVDLDREQGVMLITGPNAGGKTVTLKTVGLLAIMAQAGLHVPAEEAHFPRFDGVYADIGDQQSIQQSMSTFSSHIANLKGIMSRATAHSLVLVDELGTSTDPEEGSALASAVLRYFQKIGSFVVGTTHHRGVSRFVQDQPGMVNASVDLDPTTLEPTYHVTLGLPGRSYALTIAARLGVPQEVIDDARSGISPVEQATEGLLQELQQERRVVEELREEAETARSEAVRQQRELDVQLADVEAAKANLVEESRQELQRRISGILDRLGRAERSLEAYDLRQDAEARVRAETESVQEIQARREDVREVQRQVESAVWSPIEVERTPWQQILKEGDRVYIRGIAQPVEVIAAADNQDRVEVLLGTMRAKIPVYQLERQAEGHPSAASQGVYLDRAPRKPANADLDLRGLRVDEALSRVDEALNDAALDGAGTVRIIHGKGTGALRQAIREYLGGHPLVVSAQNGEGPGGDGITVAELE